MAPRVRRFAFTTALLLMWQLSYATPLQGIEKGLLESPFS